MMQMEDSCRRDRIWCGIGGSWTDESGEKRVPRRCICAEMESFLTRPWRLCPNRRKSSVRKNSTFGCQRRQADGIHKRSGPENRPDEMVCGQMATDYQSCLEKDEEPFGGQGTSHKD